MSRERRLISRSSSTPYDDNMATLDKRDPMTERHITQKLKAVLSDLVTDPYPYIPCPHNVNGRASVALIIRVQPSHSHWPSPKQQGRSDLKSQSTGHTAIKRLEKFFSQEWVQHGDPEILFIKRAKSSGDFWSNHVALPGGRQDEVDKNDEATAIREVLEEIGLHLSEQVSISVGSIAQRLVMNPRTTKP